MSDEADVANDNIERDINVARRVLASKQPEAYFTGECLHCGEEVKEPRRWCDADCRTLWEAHHHARNR